MRAKALAKLQDDTMTKEEKRINKSELKAFKKDGIGLLGVNTLAPIHTRPSKKEREFGQKMAKNFERVKLHSIHHKRMSSCE